MARGAGPRPPNPDPPAAGRALLAGAFTDDLQKTVVHTFWKRMNMAFSSAPDLEASGRLRNVDEAAAVAARWRHRAAEQTLARRRQRRRVAAAAASARRGFTALWIKFPAKHKCTI